MQYASSIPFGGNAGEAFGLAEAALKAVRFQITERTATSIEANGPGLNNTRQNAIAGASHIQIRAVAGKLELEADLGGVDWMSRFVRRFPLALDLCLGIALLVVLGLLIGPGAWMGIVAAVVLVNGVVWLILGPWMARSIRSRTEHALEALLAKMVSVGTSKNAS